MIMAEVVMMIQARKTFLEDLFYSGMFSPSIGVTMTTM